ncbi:hypothetical protein NL676_028629 [Syzygium grande]|nr:hypothetical protein NL676_028629 [Syzygium grande]
MMTRAAAVVVLDYLQRKGQLPPFCACRVDPSQLIFLVPAQIDPPRSSLTGIYQVQTLSLLTNGHCNQSSTDVPAEVEPETVSSTWQHRQALLCPFFDRIRIVP